MPIAIDLKATRRIPTPKAFVEELKDSTVEVLPLVDNIRRFETVINDCARGWCTYYYEFATVPEVELFCGGVNEKTPRASALWRQGNLLHFGFEQSPKEMNEIGRALLVNSIVYISRFSEDRPPPRPSQARTRVLNGLRMLRERGPRRSTAPAHQKGWF